MSDTEAYKFLTDKRVSNKLLNIYKQHTQILELDKVQAKQFIAEDKSHFYYDSKEGLWAIASESYAVDIQAGQDEVFVVVIDTEANRVFEDTEMIVLLKNEHVKVINGMPKEELIANSMESKFGDTASINYTQIFDAISSASSKQLIPRYGDQIVRIISRRDKNNIEVNKLQRIDLQFEVNTTYERLAQKLQETLIEIDGKQSFTNTDKLIRTHSCLRGILEAHNNGALSLDEVISETGKGQHYDFGLHDRLKDFVKKSSEIEKKSNSINVNTISELLNRDRGDFKESSIISELSALQQKFETPLIPSEAEITQIKEILNQEQQAQSSILEQERVTQSQNRPKNITLGY